MTSYIPQTVQDSINSLITQITNVYKAFITHTKTFFISPNHNDNDNTLNDGNIHATGDINLVSNNGMINLQSISTHDITLSANNNLTFGTTSNNDLTIYSNDITIHSNGNLFVGSNNQSITLMPNQTGTNHTGTKPLCILWGLSVPTTVLQNSCSSGSLYISTSGKLYINNGSGWAMVTTTTITT